MKFDILKTRRGKLIDKLKNDIKIPAKSIEEVLRLIDGYEKNNLDAISKLKKDRLFETKRISGALKQTINAHGPITNILIGSATKRIYGALLSNGSKTYNHYVKVHKATLMLCGVILIALLISIFLIK